MTVTITPESGSFRGGTPLQLSGPELDMSACQDSFSTGTIDASLWTAPVAGSGAATEDAVLRALVLDTGVTAASTAAVRSVETVNDVDVEAVFVFDRADAPAQSDVVAAELGLHHVASSSDFRIQIRKNKLGRVMRLLGRSAGVTVVDQQEILSAAFGLNVRTRLRLLRAGPRLYVFRNQTEVLRFNFGVEAAQIELQIRNDLSSAGSRVASRVQSYLRRPVVRFGARDAATGYTITADQRGLTTTPEVACTADAQDVVVTGCLGAQTTLSGGFTFTRASNLARFTDGTNDLVVCNDHLMTHRQP